MLDELKIHLPDRLTQVRIQSAEQPNILVLLWNIYAYSYNLNNNLTKTEMKKKFFSMLMLVMAFALAGISFVSCGDDNDEPTPNPDPTPSHPAKIGIAYSLELGDGWWDFFDIEVTYTAADGQTEIKTISKGWVYAGSVNYEDAVSEYSFTATATPKANLPEIDTNANYNFDKKADSYAFELNEKGEQTGILVSKNSASSLTISGAHLSDYLGTHTNLGAGTITVK